jgi:hypothetical protein
VERRTSHRRAAAEHEPHLPMLRPCVGGEPTNTSPIRVYGMRFRGKRRCRRFNQGEQAYTPKEIHDLTKIPQQIVNQSVKELLRARLLVEIRNGKKSSFEESVVLHPIEKIEHLTYGVMIERLFVYGEDISSLAALESDMAMWKDIDIVNAEFIEKGKQIAF